MELVLVTKNRSIGIDESISCLSDFDYFSLLPNYHSSIGLISHSSLNMLPTNQKSEIEKNVFDCLNITKKTLFYKQKNIFFLYHIKTIKPVLYEVPGYNCIINLKDDNYHALNSLQSFFLIDHNFDDNDFRSLETATNYLICSYYEGEASFIYTAENFVETIIGIFDNACIKKSGFKITIAELSQKE